MYLSIPHQLMYYLYHISWWEDWASNWTIGGYPGNMEISFTTKFDSSKYMDKNSCVIKSNNFKVSRPKCRNQICRYWN